jgi:VWFA-related protein
VLAAGLTLVPAAGWAQQTPDAGQTAPVFRSSVDVVSVDVSVLDKDGHPIEALTIDDFELKIDGRPRQVRSVEFVDQRPVGAAPTGVRPTHFSANDYAATGRLVMLAVDESSFNIGEGRPALQAAQAFIDKLTPNDHIGLTVFPGAGPYIDFTTNHRVVREALGRITGKSERLDVSINVGLTEAVAIERGDRLALGEVIARECENDDPLCGELAERQARMVSHFVTVQARVSVTAIRAMLQGLGRIEGTKTLVLVSGGLVSDSLQADITELGLLAQASQVNVYVLQLDRPRFDASLARPSPTQSADEQLLALGLETLAGAGRGSLFRVLGRSAYPFERIARELSGYYLLTFEPEEGDRDGSRHAIAVRVARQGSTVRARREFTALPTGAVRTDADRVIGLLRAPLEATKLPIRLTTYSYQESRGSKVRTLICADLDTVADETALLTLGYVVTDDKGNVVANAVDKVAADQFVATTLLEPGPYRLKLAAIDAEGRSGSVEHRFVADVGDAGSMKAGDLMLAEAPDYPGAMPRPAVDRTIGDEAMAYLELYSNQQKVLADTVVHFDVADGPEGEPILTAPPDRTAPTGRRRPAQGRLGIRLLPPGEYVVRASIVTGGQTVKTLVRPFVVTRLAAAAESAEGDRSLPDSLRLKPQLRPFDPATPLHGDVLGFFLDRLTDFQSTASAPSLQAVVAEARARQFDAASKAASGNTPGDRVLASFMRGLARYEKADWQRATVEFQAAVRHASEFFPALFYIGATFAAAGRDGDAVAAWQTSLSVDAESPPTFPFLADALVRLNDGEQAAGVLEEALEMWPDDDRFLGRLAIAYAMMGRQEQAFEMATRYLEHRANDAEALFLAMRLLYEAQLAGRAYRSDDEDRRLFRRYADAYLAANGPSRPIVTRWVKHLDAQAPQQ